MRAHILTIGDELLIGQTINTNAAWIGEQLDHAGIDVLRAVTVGDDHAGIRAALAAALAEAEVVILTGGLGPTHDDVTKLAVAEHLGLELQFHPEILDGVRDLFERRGREMPASNHTQAMVPEGSEVLPNRHGTAPGLWIEHAKNGSLQIVVLLPGVPFEMRTLMTEHVIPRLASRHGLHNIVHRVLHVSGIGESNLQELLGDMSPFFEEGVRLAYLPGPSTIRLRLTAVGEARQEAEARLDAFEAAIRERAGRFIFGTADDTLESVVGGMLRERGRTLALAESCTGGHILDRMTDFPGSSDYIKGGLVAYCNEVKIGTLQVSPETLRSDGAVSEAVAIQMARGVRLLTRADIGMSTTGIAGPSGGTPEKPVGLVWIGFSDASDAFAVKFQFGDDRVVNKERSGAALLNLLRKRLLEEESARR
jgi:nicotinamide-nucleotide amidase